MSKKKEHKRSKELALIRKLIKDNIKDREIEVTDAEVEFFMKYPHELDRLTSAMAIKKIYLTVAVLIGILLVITSIILRRHQLIFKEDGMMNTLFCDLFFEGGVALFGAAVTVYMLEILIERQEIKNRKYRMKVMSMIKEKD